MLISLKRMQEWEWNGWKNNIQSADNSRFINNSMCHANIGYVSKRVSKKKKKMDEDEVGLLCKQLERIA